MSDTFRTVVGSVFVPAVVTWNRLEPRPRTESFERSLREEPWPAMTRAQIVRAVCSLRIPPGRGRYQCAVVRTRFMAISTLATWRAGLPVKFVATSFGSASASIENRRPWQSRHTVRIIFSLGRRFAFWLC